MQGDDDNGPLAWAWIWIALTLATSFGIVARLGHMWSQAQSDATARPVTWQTAVAALICAPGMGLIAWSGIGLFEWWMKAAWPLEMKVGFCSLAGLFGPAALFAAWDLGLGGLRGWFGKRLGG